MNRREFLGTVAAAAAFPALRGQGAGTPASEWGTPVFDLHFHLRPSPRATSRTWTAPASPRPIS